MYSCDVDQHIGGCRKTAQHLVSHLDYGRSHGTVRLHLYTIMDLWRNRPGSAPDVEAAVDDNRVSFHDAVNRLKTQPQTAEWPELKDIDELISRIP